MIFSNSIVDETKLCNFRFVDNTINCYYRESILGVLNEE